MWRYSISFQATAKAAILAEFLVSVHNMALPTPPGGQSGKLQGTTIITIFQMYFFISL